MAGVGDLTGDGVQDLLVGASEYAGGDGAVAVLPGPFTGQSGTLDGGWLITGVAKAKGDVWKDMAKFTAAGEKFQAEAAKLAQVARAGDMAALKAQFNATAGTCKACHDDFREK